MYPNPDTLETGNVIFCRNDTLEGAVIRWALRSDWNHAAVVLCKMDGVYVLEATRGERIKAVPYAQWRQVNRKVEVLPCKLTNQEVKWYDGVPYDIWSCVNHVWYRLFGKWYGRKEGKGHERLYCFEYIALLYGMPEYYRATPQTIENFFKDKTYGNNIPADNGGRA